MLNGKKGNGDLRARPHPSKLPAFKKELRKIFISESYNQTQKVDADVIEGDPCSSPSKQQNLVVLSTSSGFRVKDTLKGAWNPALRKDM